jgi:hypothetical protein
MMDQLAIGPDGQLVDVSKIEWYNDPDDAHPIPPTSDLRQGLFLNIFNSTIAVNMFTCCVSSTHMSNKGDPWCTLLRLQRA